MTYERALKFKQERGRPHRSHLPMLEKKMAEGVEYLARMKVNLRMSNGRR